MTMGEYPKMLLKAWDTYAQTQDSENERPDMFQCQQKYCVLLLEDGGSDLEHFRVDSPMQARSIFCQTAMALCIAEDRFHFEHRVSCV
jgi:serine/threonine-protein kinase haspin